MKTTYNSMQKARFPNLPFLCKQLQMTPKIAPPPSKNKNKNKTPKSNTKQPPTTTTKKKTKTKTNKQKTKQTNFLCEQLTKESIFKQNDSQNSLIFKK